MGKNRIKKKTLFFELLLVYPVINIVGCTLFQGDNMTTISLTYCLILILLYLAEFRKIAMNSIIFVIALAFILVLELSRDQNMILLFLTFVITNIMFAIYSSNKIKLAEYIEFFIKERKKFYFTQALFLLVLFFFVWQNGLTAGWNTWVLQGPYNYPHTLAYIFLFVLMIDTFYFIEIKDKIAIIFLAINSICILLTAVRSALLACIIVIGYVLYRMLSKKNFKRFVLYSVLILAGAYIVYQYGMFDALFAKSRQALGNGSISNGRSYIVASSLNALKQGNVYINTLCGVGMENLLRWNGINIHANIHAHNDFVDALVGFGFVGVIIYIYNFLKFCKGKFIWIAGTLGILAYCNGLFVYSDVIPILIYARILFSHDELVNLKK